MIIYGRSDATLNPGGVRIGTAEIYRQVESLAEIQEAIVVGQDFDNDVRVVLFVVLKQGYVLDKALEDKIRQRIRSGTTPRHVPARIVAVRDIPRTKSGKITELAVRDIIHGREVKNKEALANPEALDLYRNLAVLKS
jgi:acetoacetyl-CoA synthetase